MGSRLCIKRLNKEIIMYEKEKFKFQNLIIRPSDDNILNWYFIIYDLKETPFENGVYFGKVKLPHEYPLKAPDFIFYTPSGRFKCETKICTTFSSFHQETYTSTWNILTMMQGLISFMTDTDCDGIGSIKTTNQEKIELANQSLNWNKNFDLFNSIFSDVDSLF